MYFFRPLCFFRHFVGWGDINSVRSMPDIGCEWSLSMCVVGYQGEVKIFQHDHYDLKFPADTGNITL